jgi:hypothetical protein
MKQVGRRFCRRRTGPSEESFTHVVVVENLSRIRKATSRRDHRQLGAVIGTLSERYTKAMISLRRPGRIGLVSAVRPSSKKCGLANDERQREACRPRLMGSAKGPSERAARRAPLFPAEETEPTVPIRQLDSGGRFDGTAATERHRTVRAGTRQTRPLLLPFTLAAPATGCVIAGNEGWCSGGG